MRKVQSYYEGEKFPDEFNFSDGYARYSTILDFDFYAEKLGTLLSTSLKQKVTEQGFGEVFFGLSNQLDSVNLKSVLYCPSASISIEIIANFLRLNDLSLSLIEPAFDNLPSILRRHKISLSPVAENRLRGQEIDILMEEISTDALFVVMPNNPTGFFLTEIEFKRLVNFCAKLDILLILDFCYRFFEPTMSQWSQYKILEESGANYIVLEDTGKTWATHELKVSPITANNSTFQQLRAIYYEIFLHHSPVIMELLKETIGDTIVSGKMNDILNISIQNRRELSKTITDFPLRIIDKSMIPVAWLEITTAIESNEIEEWLLKDGIRTMRGEIFFWNNPVAGRRFLRITMMRDVNVFLKGMEYLHSSLSQLFKR